VIPGISRIGMVLAAGSLCGFSRKYRAKYACLLSVPAMAGSILIELFDRETSLASDGGLVPLAAGVLFCAAAGYLFVRIARKLLVRVSNRSFAGCCLFAGIASILVYVF
jgi:undecaprenyl pyrophosphate phosphatase UppP